MYMNSSPTLFSSGPIDQNHFMVQNKVQKNVCLNVLFVYYNDITLVTNEQ